MSNAAYSMLGAGARGWPREMLGGGRWKGGSCLGMHVHPWWIHANVWQNQYSIVKKNKVKIKIKKKEKEKKKIKIIQSIFSNHNGIKLKISNRRKTHKMWKLNSTLLKNQQFKGLTREIIKYFEMSENKNTTYRNVWSTVKTVLKGKL